MGVLDLGSEEEAGEATGGRGDVLGFRVRVLGFRALGFRV